MKWKICLVDDHAVVRSGLKSLVKNIEYAECAWEFQDGQELIDLIKKGEIPDFIILDLSMPITNGDTTIEFLAQENLLDRLIILSFDINPNDLYRYKSMGIPYIFSKSVNAHEIQNAIENLIFQQSSDTPIINNINITPRELEFIRLICKEEEYTYEQIADIMGVHVRTIDSFRKSLFLKLKIKSKTGLVLYALKNNLN
jgi:DNA-binding NarL/FixJ family response regulator